MFFDVLALLPLILLLVAIHSKISLMSCLHILLIAVHVVDLPRKDDGLLHALVLLLVFV
jgi:hypothetical protein